MNKLYPCDMMIMNRIYPDKELLDFIERYTRSHQKSISFYLRLCKSGFWRPALSKNPQLKLCLVYALLPYTMAKYQAAGINETVFYDTMDDIRIWIDDYKAVSGGKFGLDELNWIMNHLQMKIFKLARLQFQTINYYFPKNYTTPLGTLKLGSKTLNVHIPRGEKLTQSACRESFAAAQHFFAKYFPKYAAYAFVCHSWLIYSKNSLFMNKDSNIIKFAHMFDIVNESENPQEAYRWLFGLKTDGNRQIRHRKKYGTYLLPETRGNLSPLQTSAVEYIKNGGILGDAMAAIYIGDKNSEV